ncbi:mitochondrial import protein Pam17-domain-containing protein [Peziza echinospora]|nr:mitochondrial import protein Pam17-domain-containing protein [Peziza echinospora]
MLFLTPTLRSSGCRLGQAARIPSLARSIATSKPSVTASFKAPTAFRKQFPTADTVRSTFRTASTQAAASAQTARQTSNPLPWEDFFQLRRTRRRYNLLSSIFTGLTATAVAAGFLGNREVDLLPTSLFGMDLLTLFGLAIAGCGALGWLCGPIIGGLMFKAMNRNVVPRMIEREKDFFNHIRKNRVDPSSQSFSNPVPDYYGEKVGSIKQYRQWLKDQRAYNRKRANFL